MGDAVLHLNGHKVSVSLISLVMNAWIVVRASHKSLSIFILVAKSDCNYIKEFGKDIVKWN